MEKTKNQSLRFIGNHIILGLWTLIVLFPVWTMLINSLKKRLDIYANPFGLPPVWNFRSYLDVIKDSQFPIYFRNSILVTLGSILIILLLGSLAAYAIVNLKGRVSRWIYVYIIAGMMFPIRIGSINLLQIIKNLNMMNTIWSLFPVYIAMGLPIAVFVLAQFIRDIPKDLTEAAYIDGAGKFRVYRSVLLPLLRPALGTVAIFNLVPFWNDLWFPLLFITKEEHKTVILGVTRLFGQYQNDWSKILAVLTLSAIPVMLLYMLMSKQFIKGLTAGAVKG